MLFIVISDSSTKGVIPVDVVTNTIGNGHEKRTKGNPVSPGVGLSRAYFCNNQISEHQDEVENRSSVQSTLLISAFNQLQERLNFLASKAESITENQTADSINTNIYQFRRISTYAG